MAPVTGGQAQVAHADAWQEIGRSATDPRAGWARLAGARLMATGLAHPQWNSGDVAGSEPVDLSGIAAWYAARGLPWGLRVPAGVPWHHGTRLFDLRLMAVWTRSQRPGPRVEGLSIRRATPDDLEAVSYVDAAAFEADPAVQRPWLKLRLAAATTTVALAELGGDPVATGYAVSACGDAGPSRYLGGIGVLSDARRRGVGGALSAWLLGDAGAGQRLAHLHPDSDLAARVYSRLGFVEVGALGVYVDNE